MSLTDHSEKSANRYLDGGGEMGEITRSYDWSKTVLGTIDTWPQSLLTTLSIILNSKFPMFLFWGPELICFYNDAYRPSLGNNGKHPAVGQRGADLWPEIWADIKPLIDRVMNGGEASWDEDLLLPIYRNGKLEDVYWTFSYSPVRGESGEVAGVFVTCSETTEKVQSLKEIRQANDDLTFTLDAAELGAWDLNPATNKFTGNNRLKDWFGLDPEEEIILTAAVNAIAEKDRQRTDDAIKAAMLSGSDGYYDIEYTIVNARTREERMVRARGKVLFNEEGVAYRFSGTLEDISQQVVARLREQELTEEVTATNEELSAANEELLATNEELILSQAEIENANFELNKATTSLEQAIDTAKMGTWSVNLVTNELSFSERARIINGIDETVDLATVDMLSMVEPEYREQVLKGIGEAIATGGYFDSEHLINPVDGSAQVWLRSTGRAYYDENGLPTSISGTMLDITESKLEEQRKNDFIGMVSHELKTPLTSLKGYVQLLHGKAKKDNDTFGATALGKADVQINKMSAMINGFLNVSRLESGQIYLNKEDFNLNELLEEVIDEILIFTTSHHIILSPHEDIIVNGDRDKIGYVVTNLLSNAIKYSPRNNSIEVKYQVSDGTVLVSIKDYGMGIKPQDIAKLFDRYYRVENKHTQYISGFGIGLYLSSEIIKRHEGKIWAESESGIGSTFYFTLPL